MLVFVDYEHPAARSNGAGTKMLAARTWITYRLEDLSGQPTMLVRWNRVTAELLSKIGASALFISGNSADPDDYDESELAPLLQLVRESELPVFGFCGGWQLIARAFDAPVVLLDVGDEAPETDVLKRTPTGRAFEFGYHPVEMQGEHPLFAGLEASPVFRHAHGLHVPSLPPGFRGYASTPLTPVQLAINDERRVVGTQFHPEYWTDEAPAGKVLIENFMRWADLLA